MVFYFRYRVFWAGLNNRHQSPARLNLNRMNRQNREAQLQLDSGDYSGCFECHVKPDWLLIYMLDNEANTATFLRTGTHADLF